MQKKNKKEIKTKTESEKEPKIKTKTKSKQKQTSKNQKAKTKQTNRFICFTHCAYQWIVKLAYKEEFFSLNLLVFWKEV